MTTVDWQSWQDVLWELEAGRLFKQKIKKYVYHTKDCRCSWGAKECTCGLDELMKEDK